MAKSLRQLLWETVRDRLRTIRRAAGYETEMGARFFSWRDLANSPLDEIKDDSNREKNGCYSMRDADCETEQKVSNRMDHTLTIEVQGAVWGTPPDDVARQALADIEACIGVDRQWTVPDLTGVGGPDVKLALDTRLVSDKINVVHTDLRYAVITKTIQVIFRTSSFNPYAQTGLHVLTPLPPEPEPEPEPEPSTGETFDSTTGSTFDSTVTPPSFDET